MLLPLFHPTKNVTPVSNVFYALSRLQKTLLNSLDFNDVVKKCVNTILDELGYLKFGYRIVVLALIDEKRQVLQRIAISETDEAKKALAITPVPFKDIVVPFSETESSLIVALNSRTVQVTTHWYDILRPAYTEAEAIDVQKAVGIKCSMVYPIYARGKPLGILIFSMVKDYKGVTDEEKILLGGFTDLVGLAVQNSLLYTSLQQTSKQLGTANNKLKELDRLKDDFVSVASHELRTPMTAIRSYAWMALHRSNVPLSDKVRRYLDRTLLSTERLINLVNEMLNISRIESGRIEIKPRVFNIIGLVKEVFEDVSIKAGEKNLKLEVKEISLPQIFADKDKVHQVLLNLIGNSLKFTPESGIITVSFAANQDVVGIAVKDTGSGIAKDDLSRLFKKFGRLDNSYVTAGASGGTGLGLYVCKSLVELMGGEIWVESPGIGQGATFYFTLPIASSEILAHPERYQTKPTGEVKGLEPVAI